jgi:hypothetical protein
MEQLKVVLKIAEELIACASPSPPHTTPSLSSSHTPTSSSSSSSSSSASFDEVMERYRQELAKLRAVCAELDFDEGEGEGEERESEEEKRLKEEIRQKNRAILLLMSRTRELMRYIQSVPYGGV